MLAVRSPSLLLVSSWSVCGERHTNRSLLIWASEHKHHKKSPKLLWFHVASVSLQTYHGPERKAFTTAHTNHNYNLGDLHIQDSKTKPVLWLGKKEKDRKRRQGWDDKDRFLEWWGVWSFRSYLDLSHHTREWCSAWPCPYASESKRRITSLIISIFKQHVVCVCVLVWKWACVLYHHAVLGLAW